MNSDAPDDRFPLASIVLSLLAVIALWLAGGYWLPMWGANDQYQPNQFGDQFGAVNALFSGLAFAGLFWAIWLQRQELSLQRHELSLTRDELQRTAAAQEAAQDALRSQVRMQLISNQLAALNYVIAQLDNDIDLRSRTHRAASDLQDRRQDLVRQVEAILHRMSADSETLP